MLVSGYRRLFELRIALRIAVVHDMHVASSIAKQQKVGMTRNRARSHPGD